MKRLTSLTPIEKKLGWFYWAFQLLVLPIVLVLLNNYLGAPMTETELNLLLFGLNFLLLILIFHKFIFHSCKSGLFRPLRTLWSAVKGLVLYLLCSALVGGLILYLHPDFINANDDTIFRMLEEHYALMVLGVVFLAPVAEELLYRGLIFGSIYSKSRILAYLVSSVLFSAIHVIGYITVYEPVELLLSLVQYLPAGLCLARAYARSGSILTPILIHMAVNLISISVY